MWKAHEITSDDVQEVTSDAMRGQVGFGKIWSYNDLSRVTGIKETTLRAAGNQQISPSLWRFTQIATALGPDFLNRWLQPFGYGGAYSVAERDSNVWLTNAALARQIHAVADRLADSIFCHRDKAETAQELLALGRLCIEQGSAMERESKLRETA